MPLHHVGRAVGRLNGGSVVCRGSGLEATLFVIHIFLPWGGGDENLRFTSKPSVNALEFSVVESSVHCL